MQAINSLKNVDSTALLQFLHPILNMLLHLIGNGGETLQVSEKFYYCFLLLLFLVNIMSLFFFVLVFIISLMCSLEGQYFEFSIFLGSLLCVAISFSVF